MSYEWDAQKAASNTRKHGVSFADAVGALEDPQAVTIDDPHPSEERFVTIGTDFIGRVIVVCWTARGQQVRLISARQASKSERRFYVAEE